MKATLSLLLSLLFLPLTLFSKLPDGFVYLSDVDPTILQSLRYASKHNFVGKIVDGYKTPRAIITRSAAEALKRAQKELLKDGYCLVIYDAYRPQKAVDHFVRWSADPSDQIMKRYYYPHVNKDEFFDKGYVAKKSGHSRGSTVDVTIIKVGNRIKPEEEISFSERLLLNGANVPYLDDGTVDMGTSFDLFDEASHHNNTLIDEKYVILRNYLCSKMVKYGFKTISEEWWHFTFNNEPFPSTYFDFDVE